MSRYLIYLLLLFLNCCIAEKETMIPSHYSEPVFIKIEPGTFTMGPSDLLHTPAHEVTITEVFSIAQSEITNAQFVYFLNDIGYIKTQPYTVKNGLPFRHGKVVKPGERHEDVYMVESQKMEIQRLKTEFCVLGSSLEKPASNITYFGAIAFCEWMSERNKNIYRLPTEAEWELACINSKGRTIGMPGHVWEWCSDWFGDYPEEISIDPMGPIIQENAKVPTKVVRGGGKTSVLSEGILDTHYGDATCKSRQFRALTSSSGLRLVCENFHQE